MCPMMGYLTGNTTEQCLGRLRASWTFVVVLVLILGDQWSKHTWFLWAVVGVCILSPFSSPHFIFPKIRKKNFAGFLQEASLIFGKWNKNSENTLVLILSWPPFNLPFLPQYQEKKWSQYRYRCNMWICMYPIKPIFIPSIGSQWEWTL